MSTDMECVECGKEAPPGNTWPVGWGCLFGMLAVCSRACAEKYATENSRYGCLPEGELKMVGEDP